MESPPVNEVQADTGELPTNGKIKTVMLSSNLTLFWRIFVPVFGTVFMTGLLLAFWLINGNDLYLTAMPVLVARLLITTLWFGWLVLMARTLWRLRRIDADSLHFYVTDYWTTVRYPWTDLQRTEEVTRWGKKIVHFHLKGKGRFGQRISFLPGTYFDIWKTENEL
jgi:hypothetical protein